MKILKKWWLLIILTIIIILIILFFPKRIEYSNPDGGLISPNETIYTKSYSCLGYIYQYNPPETDIYSYNMCVGLRYNKKCFQSSGNNFVERVNTEIQCKD